MELYSHLAVQSPCVERSPSHEKCKANVVVTFEKVCSENDFHSQNCFGRGSIGRHRPVLFNLSTDDKKIRVEETAIAMA